MKTHPQQTHQGSQVRKARVCALQMMYQWEVGREDPARVKELYWREVRAQAPREYADKLFDAATSEAADLDVLIGRFARKWKVERLTSVDRNLLRIAVTEFRHSPDIPHAIVINEALEIAKQFSGEDAYQFLNGILDAISKEKPEEKSNEKSDAKPD